MQVEPFSQHLCFRSRRWQKQRQTRVLSLLEGCLPFRDQHKGTILRSVHDRNVLHHLALYVAIEMAAQAYKLRLLDYNFAAPLTGFDVKQNGA